jgi:hypothetical protein
VELQFLLAKHAIAYYLAFCLTTGADTTGAVMTPEKLTSPKFTVHVTQEDIAMAGK